MKPTMTSFSKPTVFLSSTIYDFGDLRSAIRYWLGEFGFDVLASESNDFPQIPDQNSYDACLNAARAADFFVLLIGRRVGGWFDQKNRISITRQEYRVAREAFEKTGKPRIVAFGRRSVWDVREDRKALEKLLEQDVVSSAELPGKEKRRIAMHPSRIVNDGEAVFSFIGEVERREEMKKALAENTARPVGNWVYQFSDFAEVTAGLRSIMNLRMDLRHLILTTELQKELIRNLQQLMCKVPNKGNFDVWPNYWLVSKHIPATVNHSGYTRLKGADVARLAVIFGFHKSIGQRLATNLIREALKNGLFVQYDPANGLPSPTKLHNRLQELIEMVERLRRFGELQGPLSAEAFSEYTQYTKEQGEIQVPNQILGNAIWFVTLFERVVKLHRAVLQELLGLPVLPGMPPGPASPFTGEDEKIKGETPTEDEILGWARQERVMFWRGYEGRQAHT